MTQEAFIIFAVLIFLYSESMKASGCVRIVSFQLGLTAETCVKNLFRSFFSAVSVPGNV